MGSCVNFDWLLLRFTEGILGGQVSRVGTVGLGLYGLQGLRTCAAQKLNSFNIFYLLSAAVYCFLKRL